MFVILKPNYRPFPPEGTPLTHKGEVIGKIIIVKEDMGEVIARINEGYEFLFDKAEKCSIEIKTEGEK